MRYRSRRAIVKLSDGLARESCTFQESIECSYLVAGHWGQLNLVR